MVGVDLIAVGHKQEMLLVIVKSCEGDNEDDLVNCSDAADEDQVRRDEDGVLVLKCKLRWLNSCLLISFKTSLTCSVIY